MATQGAMSTLPRPSARKPALSARAFNALYGAGLIAMGAGFYFLLGWAEGEGGRVGMPILFAVVYTVLGKSGVAAVFAVPGVLLVAGAALPVPDRMRAKAVVATFAAAIALAGVRLLERNWLVLGGAVVLFAILIVVASIPFERARSFFFGASVAGWCGYLAYGLAREERFVAMALPLFAVVIGVIVLRDAVRAVVSRTSAR